MCEWVIRQILGALIAAYWYYYSLTMILAKISASD